MKNFGIVPIPEEPQDREVVYHRGVFIDQSTRKRLCELTGVEFKEHDHSQDVGKVIERPSIKYGRVVCGPCGNKVINFTNYCEVRGDRSYGPSGGGYEIVVCQCSTHGNCVLRAMWKDLVAHPDDLIIAFSEIALPEPHREVEQGERVVPEILDGPIIDV